MALLRSPYLALMCGLLYLTRTASSVSSSGSGIVPDCPSPPSFRCPDDSCIPLSLLCDDVPDCPSGADELVCVQPGSQDCRPDQFPCIGEDLCVSLAGRCDGVYDCSLGSDERNCPPPPLASSCNSSQFVCALSGGCVPQAVRCNGMRDCERSEDEQGCVPPLVIDPPPPSITSLPGENVTLTCVAEATPPPFITWLRNLQPLPVDPRYIVTSEGGVGTLVIRGVRALDAAEFTCQITSQLYGDRLALPATSLLVNDTSPITCEDQFGMPYSEGDRYYATQTFTTGPANQAAADIIFVVDESGSMALEHEWIREEVFNLDRRLREQGVGVGERDNLFGLVGFARDSPSDIIGIVLSQLASPENFVAASQELLLNGLAEDGYAAIIYALDNILTRSGTAKQIILVTDEDRAVLRQDLNRDVVEERLREAGFVLNVVVNQGFLADPSDSDSHALGLDSNGTAYVVNTTAPALFMTVEGGVVDPDPFGGFGNTFSDYVELAFSLGGAAWDINQLREQGIFAEAFSNAFTEVKVEEVMSVFMVCALCTCASPEPVCVSGDRSVENCFGPAPGVLTVLVTPAFTFVPPGSRVSFQCLVHGIESEDSLDFTWTYPPQPGVVAMGQTLLISSAGLSSEGMYTCTVSDNSTGSVTSASGILEIDERCTVGGSTLLPGETRIILEVPPGNMSKAADVILIVDESGSMTLEHAWIPDMTVALNGALRDVGIGIEPQNRFGVVGFGADCEDPGFGRVITNNADQVFTFASNITDFTMSLDTSGRREDGYSGIKTALEGYEFRNVAKQFILITDEDRDVARPNLTRDVVQEMLQRRGVLLNVVVNEEFAGGKFRALGVDNRGNAYVYDPSAALLFRVIEGDGTPVEDSGHGSTNMDYTGLALELGGGAWDLNTLREGGEVAEAFTNAFVQVKVLEIRAQMEECLNCSCSPSGPVCEVLQGDSFAECMPPPVTPLPGETALSLTLDPPDFARVLPGEQVTVTCEANQSASLGWTFNGGLLPDNAVVIPGSSGQCTELVITGAERDNTGTYACLGHSPSNAINAAAFIFIEYFDPEEDLQLSLSPLDPTVTRGQNVSLNCQVPEPAFFSWFFDFGPLPSNALTRDGVTESVLTVLEADPSNIGGYTCLVNNTVRDLVNEDTTYLDVREPVLVLSVSPQLVDVLEGSVVSVLCTVDCFCPGAILEWITSTGESLPPNAEIFSSEGSEGEPRLELFFSSVVVGDSGRYLCSAQFQGMTADLEAILTVRAIPPPFTVIIGGPDVVMLTAGSPYFALCEANQNTSLIEWRFNDIAIPVQPSNKSDPAELVIEDLLPGGLEVSNVVAVSLPPLRLVLAVLQATEENSGNYECRGVALNGSMALDEIEIIVVSRPASPTPTVTELASSPSLLPPFTPSPFTAAPFTPSPFTAAPFTPSPFTIAPVTPTPSADASPTSRLSPSPSPSPPPPFSVSVSEPLLQVEEGADVSVVCSSNHPASFVWTGGVGLPSNARVEILGPLRSQLVIVDIQQLNSRMYVCNASSRLTGEVATAITTINVIVIVTTPPPTPDIPPEDRVVTVTPDNIRIPPGALAVFTCNANTITQVFEWQFIFDDPVPMNAQPTMLNRLTSQLVIRNISQDNAGTYFCHANFSDGVRRTGIAQLIFDEPLKVRIIPHPKVRVPEGNRTQIDCSLDCSCGGDTRLDWRRVGFDSLPISAVLMPSPSGRTVSLIFETTSADVAGTYKCVATRTSSEPASLGVLLIVE